MVSTMAPRKTNQPILLPLDYCHIISGVSRSVNRFYIPMIEITHWSARWLQERQPNLLPLDYCNIISGVSRKLILYPDN